MASLSATSDRPASGREGEPFPRPALVDAHAHIFPAVRGRIEAGPTRGLGHGRIAVGAAERQLTPDLGEQTAFGPESLAAAMAAAGVERAVLLQGTFYGECNDYAAAAVRRYPDRFAAQAYLDPWTAGWERRLAGLLERGEFRGIKIEFSQTTGLSGLHPGARLDEAGLEPLWRALARRQSILTLDLGAVGTPSYQTQAVARLAAEHSGLTVVVCHLAQPGPALSADPAALRLWEAQIRLGRLPNVHFDIASLPGYFQGEGDPFPSCREFLKRAVDLIGPEKILWGSDTPGTLTLCAYRRYAALACQHVDFLPAPQQEMILSANARRVYFRADSGPRHFLSG
jgi:predicted TIM-barrel fold metal-dependent hydrolase